MGLAPSSNPCLPATSLAALVAARQVSWSRGNSRCSLPAGPNPCLPAKLFRSVDPSLQRMNASSGRFLTGPKIWSSLGVVRGPKIGRGREDVRASRPFCIQVTKSRRPLTRSATQGAGGRRGASMVGVSIFSAVSSPQAAPYDLPIQSAMSSSTNSATLPGRWYSAGVALPSPIMKR